MSALIQLICDDCGAKAPLLDKSVHVARVTNYRQRNWRNPERGVDVCSDCHEKRVAARKAQAEKEGVPFGYV